MYKDSIGNIHIVGELQNNFRYPINFVQVIATLYDASKQVVGTSNTYTDVDFLRPGERSGFDIILSNSNNAVNYALQATYERALTTKSAFLNLSVGKGYQDSIGNYHLVGEVSNIGNNATRFVKVSSIFFDANNKVIDAVTTYTNPSDLQPGQKAPFDLLSISPNSKEIKFAVVDVQSEDYSHNGAQQLLTLSQTLPASTMKSSSTTIHGGGSPNPQHKLLVVIRIAKNPIIRGNTQTISVTVSDSKISSVKIPGAKVNGEVLYVTGYCAQIQWHYQQVGTDGAITLMADKCRCNSRTIQSESLCDKIRLP